MVIDTIGHLVGEHVMFFQEVLVEFINPVAGITITADRFRFRDAKGEIRFIGTVDKPQGLSLTAVLSDGVATIHTFPVPIAIDPLTGTATYAARDRNIEDLGSVTQVTAEARDATGTIQASEIFPRQ